MDDSPGAARIAPFEGEMARGLSLNIFRTLVKHPDLMEHFNGLGGFLLRGGLLPRRQRELVILRTGWRSGSVYEFAQHRRIGGRAGLTDEEIDRLASASTDEWDDADRDLVAFVDELCAGNDVSDETWERLAARWSEAELLELLVVAGFYRLVSGMLNSAGVEVEPGTPGWPAGAAAGGPGPADREARVPTGAGPAPAVARRANGGRLQGRRLLVVGGGTRSSDDADAPAGNGRAISVAAARQGATVAVADVHADAAETTAALVRDAGAAAHVVLGDARDEAACGAVVETAAASIGGLDGLVCNVGIGAGLGLAGTSVEDWDRVFAVNVRSNFLLLRAALPLFADGASVVLVSSLAGLRPGSRSPSYDASKAAQLGLLRHAAAEGARAGVRVNAVAPGLIDTPMGRAATDGRPGRATTRIPLRRQGTAWEVADAVVFLLSGESSYITGQVLAVDGGLSTLG